MTFDTPITKNRASSSVICAKILKHATVRSQIWERTDKNAKIFMLILFSFPFSSQHISPQTTTLESLEARSNLWTPRSCSPETISSSTSTPPSSPPSSSSSRRFLGFDGSPTSDATQRFLGSLSAISQLRCRPAVPQFVERLEFDGSPTSNAFGFFDLGWVWWVSHSDASLPQELGLTLLGFFFFNDILMWCIYYFNVWDWKVEHLINGIL